LRDPGVPGVEAIKERQHRVDKGLRLIDVDGVSCGGDHHLLRAGNLGRHVVGGGEERGVVSADHDQRRHLDVRQRFNHAGITLGQHAARGAGKTRRIAMRHARALAA
jgi:hypothetical protein